MTITRKLAPLTALALSAVVLLAGCTSTTGPNAGSTKTPSSSATPKTPSSTATPKPTPSATTPAPASVKAPADSDAAFVEANKTINLFAQVQYAIEAEGGRGVERIEPFASGEALTTTQTIASDLSAKGLSITGGTPGWEPNASVTTFGDVQPSSGAKVPNGIAYVKGCWDLSKQKTLAATGTPPADRTVTRFPVQFNVTYFPSSQTWKVTSQTNISKEAGAPQC